MTQPVFRFAPSPNGLLHLGHALSALLNSDLATRSGGRLLVRIEDIDPGRSTPELEAAIFEDLEWLGLDWETPVRRQSMHIAEYAAALDALKTRGLVYPCFCSRGEIRTRVQALGSDWPSDPDGVPLYPGTCRTIDANERTRRIAANEPHVWRLDMAAALEAISAELTWAEIDETRSERTITADPRHWGDVVLGRRDVPASYHLAVVLDDALQSITHIVRGRDLYHATSIHRLLQALLALPSPLYTHHRLILGPDRRKLSKSEGAQSLKALRAGGATPADIRARVGL